MAFPHREALLPLLPLPCFHAVITLGRFLRSPLGRKTCSGCESQRLSPASSEHAPHPGGPSGVRGGRRPPEDSRLPLLPLMILPLLPMLASLDVFSVPVSVRSMAISLRLRAAWIFD